MQHVSKKEGMMIRSFSPNCHSFFVYVPISICSEAQTQPAEIP